MNLYVHNPALVMDENTYHGALDLYIEDEAHSKWDGYMVYATYGSKPRIPIGPVKTYLFRDFVKNIYEPVTYNVSPILDGEILDKYEKEYTYDPLKKFKSRFVYQNALQQARSVYMANDMYGQPAIVMLERKLTTRCSCWSYSSNEADPLCDVCKGTGIIGGDTYMVYMPDGELPRLHFWDSSRAYEMQKRGIIIPPGAAQVIAYFVGLPLIDQKTWVVRRNPKGPGYDKFKVSGGVEGSTIGGLMTYQTVPLERITDMMGNTVSQNQARNEALSQYIHLIP